MDFTVPPLKALKHMKGEDVYLGTDVAKLYFLCRVQGLDIIILYYRWNYKNGQNQPMHNPSIVVQWLEDLFIIADP